MLNQEFRSAKRGKAFTEHEKLLLYQCMLPDLEILENKAMDSISVVRKTEAWRRVTVKFNSDPNVFQRTTEQLKKCFENAKCRKQWIVPPDSATGILEPVGQSATARTGNAPSLGRLFHNKVTGAVVMEDNALPEFGRYHEDVHSNLQQRLDSIKCELVDIADGSDDVQEGTGDASAVVETHIQPVLNDFVEEADHSEYTGQQSLLEQRLTNSEDIGDDLEDVTGTIFLDQSIYHTADAQRGYNLRKRLRRRGDVLQIDGDASHNDHGAKTSRSSQIEALQERLLKAQVREAEAAASAAEIQLQLNEMAFQHAQAEETRRKQLHAMRVRRLTQLLRDQSGAEGDC